MAFFYENNASIFDNFNYFNMFTNFMWEDLLVVLFLYNFFKYIILCSINELICPTHMFNRKHTTSYVFIRFRTYTEYLQKLNNTSSSYKILNFINISYLLNFSSLKNFLKK